MRLMGLGRSNLGDWVVCSGAMYLQLLVCFCFPFFSFLCHFLAVVSIMTWSSRCSISLYARIVCFR